MTQTKEEKNAKRRVYWAANRERMAAKNKARREANKEKLSIQQAASYERHKEKRRARRKDYRESHKEEIISKKKADYRTNIISNLVLGARRRAKDFEIPFDLIPDDITIPEFCPAVSIPLFIGEGKIGDNSPTLDRIIPELGYVKNNVVVISWLANRIKNNATADQILAVGNWLKSYENKIKL